MRLRTLRARWFAIPFSVLAIALCTSSPAWRDAVAEKQSAGDQTATEEKPSEAAKAPDEAVQRVMQVQDRWTNRLLQKYGRTTRLTDGSVIGINATVNVGYSAGTARFVKQIVVMGRRAGFIKAGDSGSLLVTRDGNHPVGLLFAGSLGGRFSIGNRIDDVLEELHVTIDGN